MKDFPPNIDPKIATLSASLIGIAIADDFSAAEQNAIGNWLILIGQTLFTNGSWQAMIESRIKGNTININSKNYKCNGDVYMDNPAWTQSPTDMEIERLKRVVAIMQEEIKKMQQKKNY